MLDALIDGASTPEDRARRREELGQTFALLDRIKPKQRIAFVLVAVEGLTLGEAAELVGAHPTPSSSACFTRGASSSR
jgi:DNA-directed RNA polymerase specialized sigma24 family protein